MIGPPALPGYFPATCAFVNRCPGTVASLAARQAAPDAAARPAVLDLALSLAQSALGSGDQQVRGFGGGQCPAGVEQVEAVEAGQQA